MSGKNVTDIVLADVEGIAKAARILESGGLVAVPTETVYGLAARADSPEAVARIYAAKGRPDFNPLIVHVRDLEQAERYGVFAGAARVLAGKEWPGPLTLVVPRRADAGLAGAVSAGLPTIAMRAPQHPVMRALLQAVDFPLAAPSANRSGFISPTTPEHVLASLDGRIDMVLDGGPCEDGVESTILLIDPEGVWHELRPGPIYLPALNDIHFDPHYPVKIVRATGERGIEAPGQLASHYAPGKPVRLNAGAAEPDEFLIGFGAVHGDCTLSASGDINEAAARLYACLHEAARARQPRIAVATVPDEGVGRAINDRLRRAAA
ncbi:threonylcarbamoyl-AMP synthase [Porphyrobacter sp. HT-58-2]|uniref:L-threonylcarbamoyladenylate synthase n=1 Tax=Porphyrobacter sp. HT-58-2 TaxID=2023229 RepID=UPI000CDC9AE1|nr:L-threonylcarbamoyladenylate synthase [Porphyrobacter sp. HT-58-2]AUX68502.1 threonylcarbamoyl-AMP synthase [Porphyrobacter sp. HT-58-2]